MGQNRLRGEPELTVPKIRWCLYRSGENANSVALVSGEPNLSGQGLTVLVAKMPVGLHGERAAILVAEPAGSKKVPEVMMGDALDAKNL